MIYETFSEARTIKDDAMKALLDAEADLNRLKHKEKELAALISDDHIIADEMNKRCEWVPSQGAHFTIQRALAVVCQNVVRFRRTYGGDVGCSFIGSHATPPRILKYFSNRRLIDQIQYMTRTSKSNLTTSSDSNLDRILQSGPLV